MVPVIYLFYLGKKSEAGGAPGLIENQLTKCPGTPNCVCSEYSDDVEHFIDPVHGIDTLTAESIVKLVEQLGGQVNSRTDTYVSAIFVSRWFGFVDDVEFRIDEQKGIIHIRSASREGHSDLGVNRQRVENIKKSLQAME
ncbi:MAG: DUF1499 domain-containing protein [Gammaproteobacteria bacterium]|nr:DUF1499 domain-containing protein [Gammaproteobacteria bacterium]